MASTDLVTPARRKIYVGDVESGRPNSSNVNNTLGGNINYILDRLFFDEDFTYAGYFKANTYDDGMAGNRYIEKDCNVAAFQLAIQFTGISGTSGFNIGVYDETGAFVNDLFVTPISISGNSGTRVLIGQKNVDTLAPANITINNAGHTVVIPVLNLTTLLAGYMLVPRITGFAQRARNMHFKLRLKEL